MKDKKKILYTGLLLLGIVAIITVNTASSKDDPAIVAAAKPQWVYSAKFVCGQAIDTPAPAPVVPADYRTAINVHNPQGKAVEFSKKVVLALSENSRLIPPSEKKRFGLGPDFAFEIDCQDIIHIGNIPATQTFAKGFVVITTPEPLDVIGVYTSTSAAAGGGRITLDVEEVTPKRIKDADP